VFLAAWVPVDTKSIEDLDLTPLDGLLDSIQSGVTGGLRLTFVEVDHGDAPLV
jgi:hypothetical protein